MRLTTFQNDGLTFRVVDEGPVDGEVVVLLHGFPQGPASWDRVAPLLHAAGYRTVAPEQRGYSVGARPRGRRAYALHRLVGDAAALVEAIGAGPVHVVGHDWGAVVAWGLASRRPELVRSLVAVSVAHPGAFLRSLVRSDQLLRSWYMGFFQLPRVPEKVLSDHDRADTVLAKGGMDERSRENFHAQFATGADLTGPLSWYRALPFAPLGFLRGRVSAPTTMVWSDRDVALGRKGPELAQEYVDAPYELVVLQGVSHWIPEEAPEALAEAVLDRVRPA